MRAGTERYRPGRFIKSQRLKPHAIDIRVDVDPVHWFLNDRDDTRSSYYLEDAATEFQVQGLELDWTCVTWDGDLRFTGSGWSFHDFRGDRWRNIRNPENRAYLRNAYRVLLTRARQGMVIFVPPGDPCDPTRSPTYYDCYVPIFVRARGSSTSVGLSIFLSLIFLHYPPRSRIITPAIRSTASSLSLICRIGFSARNPVLPMLVSR